MPNNNKIENIHQKNQHFSIPLLHNSIGIIVGTYVGG